jgi:two-component sensor histidine kinase
VALNEKAAETLALALHELATNAVKYGALAKTKGKLEVRWAIRNGPVVIEWRETGIEVKQTKLGRGYGRELIEVALSLALKGG